MECLLRWWDEFDDLVAASRHLMATALDEATLAAAPLATFASALLILLQRGD